MPRRQRNDSAYGLSVPTDRTAFGAFLRARRDRLTPSQAGIDPFPGPRRVTGLRKEELAFLAGMSSEHYSRLEQGRQRYVTDEVVDALARALQLDEVEHAHLKDLAAPRGRQQVSSWEAPQRADPGLVRVMVCLDHVPALLLGRRMEVLASNDLVRGVLGTSLEPGSSFMHWLFLEPQAREQIENWSEFARAAVGSLRYEAGRHPHDRRLVTSIADLRDRDLDVARWWLEHHVADQTSVTKRIAHPVVGQLAFGIELVTTPHNADQRLVIYTVQPNSYTETALPLVRSWMNSDANGPPWEPAGRSEHLAE